ncbi:4,5-DOPA dioxygenase extradiol [Flexithrix dorotheae]|uniref:4,5-DOPA-extradiol-dioxygenase n=1 Tax=Flexithrix dorotheae TaxID=70993 RepID=UPI00036A3A2F|nr:4,5-DOPA dioxygenase extradiol [Flexithrix dorotheae]
MTRKEFIKTAGLGIISIPMITSLKSLEKLTNSLPDTEKMPALFMGHGSPMNGIEDNEFVREMIAQGKKLNKPEAILVISAHWETNGTYVTAMENPRTIHDFGGFPQELYAQQYPAPGHPVLAEEISKLVQPENTVHLDDKWGLDHGAWTVVKHLFPKADVPVIQLSIDYTKDPTYHYQLANQLKKLRKKGVLIVGSGNIVHNLGKIAWGKLNQNYGYDWAIEMNEKVKKWILEGSHHQLIDFNKQGVAFNLSIPTPEHFLPLIYTLGVKDESESIALFNDQYLGGSIAMTSVKFG